MYWEFYLGKVNLCTNTMEKIVCGYREFQGLYLTKIPLTAV